MHTDPYFPGGKPSTLSSTAYGSSYGEASVASWFSSFTRSVRPTDRNLLFEAGFKKKTFAKKFNFCSDKWSPEPTQKTGLQYEALGVRKKEIQI